MKRFVFMALAAFLLANAAHAAGFYLSGHLEARMPLVLNGNVLVGDNQNLTGTVGYAFNSGIRLEVDVLTVRLHYEDMDFSDRFSIGLNPGTVKCLYDITTWKGLTPYAGGGLTSFSWYAGGYNEGFNFTPVGVIGVKYAINSRFSLDLQYNLGYTYDPDYSYITNIFLLGVVYQFGVKD